MTIAKLRDRMLIAAAFCFIAAILARCEGIAEPEKAGAHAISGEAVAIDGDTLSLGKYRIRLFGIDAPELRQRCVRNWIFDNPWCGREALDVLARLLKTTNGYVTCRELDLDTYGRTVAVCKSGETDLAEAMTEQGWALAYTAYQALDPERMNAYLEAEHRARKAKRGLWALEFENPWDWRRDR